MNFQAKTYKRLGAMVGAIIGVFSMIIAMCVGKNMLSAILLILFVGIGTFIGSIVEKKYS